MVIPSHLLLQTMDHLEATLVFVFTEEGSDMAPLTTGKSDS